MDIKIEGWKVTLHNENGDRLELKGEFEAEFFKSYDNKQLIIANIVGQGEQLLDFAEWIEQVSIDDLTNKEIVEFYLSRKVKQLPTTLLYM